MNHSEQQPTAKQDEKVEKVTAGDEEPSRLLRWLEARISLTEFFSAFTIFGIFYTELSTQLPLRQALRSAISRPLPPYARWPRILGPLSLLVLVQQIITGVLLAFYYQPTPVAAHDSMRVIVSETPLGWFVHQTHSWGSTLLIVLLFLRLLRLAFDSCFRPPRELLWVSGGLLLLLAMHADFTGLLLGWSDRAYWTTVRGMEVIQAIPVLGDVFVFLVGGSLIGELTLVRFYVLHLIFVPALLLAVYAISFGTVRRVGLSGLPADEEQAGKAHYRAHLFNLVISMLLLFGGLVTLAVLAPLPFRPMADPLQTLPGAAPPWYLLAPHALLELGPAAIPRFLRGLVILLLMLSLLCLPFFLKNRGEPRQRLRLGRVVTVCVVLGWLALTLTGAALEGRLP